MIKTMNFLELKIPPVALLLIAISGMGSAQLYLPNLGLPNGFALSLAIINLTIGLTIIILAVWHFRQQRTTVNPHFPENSSLLITSGILQRTRNPMYLGFVFVIIAAGLAMQSFLFPIVAIGFILYVTRFQIIPEERALLKLFSQEFAQYTKSTPRWI